jgi:hypothetical protein
MPKPSSPKEAGATRVTIQADSTTSLLPAGNDRVR